VGLWSVAMGADSHPPIPGVTALLTRLAKQVYRRSDEELLGIHVRLLMTLSYLRDHDGCPQQELGEALCMEANNVVLLLNELEDRGHITRRRDPDDRRRHLVELTPLGRRTLVRGERVQERIEDEVLQALDARERASLRQLLARALQGAEPTPSDLQPAPGGAHSATIASIST
jgi:MarR family transcriptional regulator, temperature-dependent positive regulator of motility